VREVRRRAGHPTHFSIRIDFEMPSGELGHFAFEIGAKKNAFVVKTEECAVGDAHYRVEDGKITIAPAAVSPPSADDRLYLVNAAGLPAFRPVFDVLSNMGFYSLNPDKIRSLQAPDKGELLARDGFNLASVLERLQKIDGGASAKRITEYMGKIVPGLVGVVPKRVEHMETLEFLQEAGTAPPWKFPAINMSDGTLRALGVLVALLQAQSEPKIRVVGIEEPESALHPAAAGVLRDALREASRSTQVLVTSHSPELLDDRSIVDHEIVSVSSEAGETQISSLDDSSRYALRERLFTVGELLRANQLFPDRAKIPHVDQLDLFRTDPR